MRFMIIIKATKDSEAGIFPDDNGQLMADMAAYHEELVKADMLLDGSGLKPSAKGWRIKYDANGQTQVVDGPFAETKELVAGYTLIKASSREEALEWTKRFPMPFERGTACEIEVRELYELSDFAQYESSQRFRDMGIGGI